MMHYDGTKFTSNHSTYLQLYADVRWVNTETREMHTEEFIEELYLGGNVNPENVYLKLYSMDIHKGGYRVPHAIHRWVTVGAREDAHANLR